MSMAFVDGCESISNQLSMWKIGYVPFTILLHGFFLFCRLSAGVR